MLDEFVIANTDEIIARVRERVASRTGPESVDDRASGIPVFLTQLGVALRLADKTDEIDHDQIRKSASEHGDDLLRMGLDIDDVVLAYGDVCQTITALAMENDVPVPTEEFGVMNLCLDDAIAAAVTKFSEHHDRTIEAEGAESLGVLARQMRSLLANARRSFDIIKRGQVAAGGATGKILEHSLASLSDLVERTLANTPSTDS